MIAFRVLLITAWLALAVYTAMVIADHGLNLLPIFFGNIARGAWPGQFNADFLCFLGLSALWTAWRNAFSPGGLALALMAFVGGAGFLLLYLLILSIRSRGDVAAMLMGKRRMERLAAGQHSLPFHGEEAGSGKGLAVGGQIAAPALTARPAGDLDRSRSLRLPIRNHLPAPLTIFIEPVCDQYEVPSGGEAAVILEGGYAHSIDVHPDSWISIWNEGYDPALVELFDDHQFSRRRQRKPD